jgi:hypothetical protein
MGSTRSSPSNPLDILRIVWRLVSLMLSLTCCILGGRLNAGPWPLPDERCLLRRSAPRASRNRTFESIPPLAAGITEGDLLELIEVCGSRSGIALLAKSAFFGVSWSFSTPFTGLWLTALFCRDIATEMTPLLRDRKFA